MNDPGIRLAFVDDGVRWLNISSIDAIENIPRPIPHHPSDLPRRRVTMRSGVVFESGGTRDELLEKAADAVNKGLVDDVDFGELDDVRFPAPGRPIGD